MGMGNMGKMMKQVQQMQAKMAKLQEELADLVVEASSGGGVVTVQINGKQEVVSIHILPEAVDPEDIEILEDTVRAAVNEALRKVQERVNEEMAKVTGGLKLPGLI